MFGWDGEDETNKEWIDSLFNDTPKIIRELEGTVCYKGAYNDFMTFHRQFRRRIKNFNYGKWNQAKDGFIFYKENPESIKLLRELNGRQRAWGFNNT